MIYRCIAIHSVAIHVSIQQNVYRYIDILMYWSMNCFLQWINDILLIIVVRKTLYSSYGDGHGFIAT